MIELLLYITIPGISGFIVISETINAYQKMMTYYRLKDYRFILYGGLILLMPVVYVMLIIIILFILYSVEVILTGKF